MQYTFVVGLTVVLSTAAIGAEKPIPQDSARMEKQFRERLEWNRQTLGVAYDKIGKKDPRWDKPASQALNLAALTFSQQYEPLVRLTDVHPPAKSAIDAGCNDPLILYLYARSSVGEHYPAEAELNRRVQAAADAMSSSKYSPYRRAVALRAAAERKAAKISLTGQETREIQRVLDAVVDLLPSSVAEDPRTPDWEAGWYATINGVIAEHRRLISDYKVAFDRVDARLAKVQGIEALRLTVKGSFLLYWGWEARTQQFASGVNDEQIRTFQSRLQQARAALEAAWNAKPGEPRVAELMLEVEKAIGGGDRQAMETWFERAMMTDGNNQRACWTKLDWLDPKWYGGDSFDNLLAFGKACAATRNWHTGITLLAADAHLRYWKSLPQKEGLKYMRSPEVWKEIQSVYDEYLQHYPEDHVQRSKYAMLCYVGAHYAEAHAQFQAVGNRLAQWQTFPFFPLAVMKQAREHAAQVVSRKVRPGNAPAVKDPAHR
jgi:hypothetical protein